MQPQSPPRSHCKLNDVEVGKLIENRASAHHDPYPTEIRGIDCYGCGHFCQSRIVLCGKLLPAERELIQMINLIDRVSRVIDCLARLLRTPQRFGLNKLVGR